jgi:hypothetical protein
VDLAGGEDKALAVAYQRNRAGATGFGTSAAGDRDMMTRLYDLVHRELLWDDVRDPSGGGDDEGLAAVVADRRLFVTGRAAEHPIVLAIGFNRPKVLHWQVISPHRGAARSVTAMNGRVFAAGTIEGADGVRQCWIAAYDGF